MSNARSMAIAAAATTILGTPVAFAQEGEDTTPATVTVSASANLGNDYSIFGIKQNDSDLAATGSLTFTAPDSSYATFFAGTVSRDMYAGSDGVEIDVGAGRRFDIGNGWTADASVLGFFYPGINDYDAVEGAVVLSRDNVSAKFERIFPFNGGAQSTAVTLSGSAALPGGFSLNGSIGRLQPDVGFGSNFASIGVSHPLGDNASLGFSITGNDRPVVVGGRDMADVHGALTLTLNR